MTAGQRADRALTSLHKASGQLGQMVVLRTIHRWRIEEVIAKVESALEDLRAVVGKESR